MGSDYEKQRTVYSLSQQGSDGFDREKLSEEGPQAANGAAGETWLIAHCQTVGLKCQIHERYRGYRKFSDWAL